MLRLIRWTAASLAAVLALVWGVVWLARANPDDHAAMLVRAVVDWTQPTPLEQGADPPFSLIDSHGQSVTGETYRGKWMLVYFGYTYCPDICPATLQTIVGVLDQLGDQAAQIVPIFITVDPARDTPAVMAQYVALFDQRLVGLTGTPGQIASAEAAYRVSSRRINSPRGDGYMIDHSSYLYLQSPNGKLKALFKDGVTEADMVAVITVAMSQRG